ncbi:hypothetical protein AXK11_07930 [Cephaloticoccus primus]|uniref:SIS domain-containing protein n=1 Tax=Cephaloticoccus primus TaxID=1548207 RepID=A0A139SJI2_9BACT|nr:SIS domain-containing protein [Cephaloticoccus primus]KXU34650.1 hypothetical protein AXK11_07930 [Cephaloticoccus primus]
MTFAAAIDSSVAALRALHSIRPQIDRAAELILGTLRHDKKLLICGNGGSAAEAAHFATELVGRYKKSRAALPAISLSSDGSLLSCIGNDYGFDQVFARQIAGLARPGDLVVAISSSGNSPNIVAALHEAKALGLQSIALLGRGGGAAAPLAGCALTIPSENAAACQEAHLFLIHYFCELIDSTHS